MMFFSLSKQSIIKPLILIGDGIYKHYLKRIW